MGGEAQLPGKNALAHHRNGLVKKEKQREGGNFLASKLVNAGKREGEGGRKDREREETAKRREEGGREKGARKRGRERGPVAGPRRSHPLLRIMPAFY